MFAEDSDVEPDFEDPFADVVDDAEGEDVSEPAVKASAKGTKASSSAEPAASGVDPALETLASIGLAALKNSWVEEAKAAGVVAVDFDAIPMTGLDETAKAAFIETAKANEASERARLEALGFVYAPGTTEDQRKAAAEEAADQAQAVAWGSPGPLGVLPSGNVENDKLIADRASKGDVKGVIASLPALGDFIMKGKRQL